MNKNTLGKLGEAKAKKYFLDKDYVLIKENYRFNRAETDLIFEDTERKTLVFVEVKTRRSKRYGEPEESVTKSKKEQLIKSAEGFLMEHPEFDGFKKRIDVITIYKNGKKEIINHIENAI